MDRNSLNDFPTIQAAFDHVGPDDPAGMYLAGLITVLEDHGYDYGIGIVENALSSLLDPHSFDVLAEQVVAIFRDDREWDKATTELLGLAHFHALGLLESIGWPPGGTPPFDGRISIAGHAIPFDIKSSSGTGVHWLTEALSPTVDEWAAREGLGGAELVFKWTGPTTRQAIARHRNALVTDLRAQLDAAGALPVSADLVAGGTTVSVSVRARSGSTTHGGVVGVQHHADTIAETLRDHADDKAAQADAQGAVPFFIAYVRPPCRGGSDISGYAMQTALRGVNAAVLTPTTDLWLGSLLLDWTPSGAAPQTGGLLRPGAQWPLDLGLFADRLAIDEWPLALH